MLGHGAPVAVDVDRLAALLRELHGQLEREPVRGGERERLLARDRVAAGERLELAQAPLERVAEALLLGASTTRSISSACSTTSGYHGPTCSTTIREMR